MKRAVRFGGVAWASVALLGAGLAGAACGPCGGGEAPRRSAVDGAPTLSVDASAFAGYAGDAGDGGDAAEDAAPEGGSYGTRRSSESAGCDLARGSTFVDQVDRRASFVDGDDMLALVNRAPTGGLSPDFAPSDLVDVASLEPADKKACEKKVCLRKAAAEALRELLAAMRARNVAGSVESAYRSYGAQCATFLRWADKSNFCAAAEQSALPGHSQHQLGTAIDLFTEAWRREGGDAGVFRNGFGCSPGGAYLRDEAWQLGFVLPYPIHPDDRHPKRACETRSDGPAVGINPLTGYRNEAWHLRFIGKDAARAYHEASTRDPALSLEQWLRARRGLSADGDTALPVCDGCNCGACASLDEANACGARALRLDDAGMPRAVSEAPRIVSVSSSRKGAITVLEVKVHVPPGTLTQPPGTPDAVRWIEGATFLQVAPVGLAAHAYPPLPGAWRLGVSADQGKTWPYRVALATRSPAALYNKANVVLPAEPGDLTLRVLVEGPPSASLRAALVRGDGEIVAAP